MFLPEVENLHKIHPEYFLSVKTINEVINNFQIESLKRELSIIERYYSENEPPDKFIDVVVLGQFKAGKSSLINSIIGEELLPVGVIPVTSIITRLQYGEERRAHIRFLNNKSKEINLYEIDDFITESKNPKNIKQIEVVDLFLPELQNFRNIRIVDTPGLGSFFKNNSDTTLQWLPEIGLALMTISVERPLSGEDIILLKSIIRYAAGVNIILTKTDLIAEHQLDEIKKYIEKSLMHEGFFVSTTKDNSHADTGDNHHPLEILSHSIKNNSSISGSQLYEKIFVPLEQNLSGSFTVILNHKINSLIQSCLSYLRIGLESNCKTEKEREGLKHSIIDEHLKFQLIKKELDIISASYKNLNREFVSGIVMSFSGEIIEKLENDFQKEFYSWQVNLYKLARRYELWLQNSLKELLMEYGERSILQLHDYLKVIQNHYDLFATSFAERLNRNVEKVLGIKLNIMVLHTELEKIKQPDISVSYSFDIHIDLLWFLFPMFLFRRVFQKFFRNKIPYEVNKNLSRLTSDIAESIRGKIDQNRKLVSTYIQNELSTIENLIKSQKYESTGFKEAIEKLEKISLKG